MKSNSSPTIKSFLMRPLTWGVILTVFAVAFGLISYSKTANAGLFSFVAAIVGSEEVAAKTPPKKSAGNSQTIALLAAAVNEDPNPEKTVDLVPVDDDGETLMADISALNTGDGTINTQISTYTVRTGDTLASISKMFGVSVNTIVWANNVSRTAPLKVGQSLIILPVSGISYTVKKGDTISGIVKKYKADLQEVLDFNDLTADATLKLGQIIIIPDAELTSVELPAGSTAKSPVRAGNDKLIEGWTWPSIPGYFIRPIVGGTRTQKLHGHNGVDLGAPVGTSVRAAAAGTVIIAKASGWNGGYGNYIVISHPNGTQTLYSHLSKLAVKVGEQVGQGEAIGNIGMTGLTTGPHLHFEIRGAANPF